MKRKGFTLIELLAVIVILAIIALIATPIILNMIEDARKSASIDSAYGYIESIEYANSMNMLDSKKYPSITESDVLAINNKVNLKGTKPTSGTVTITDGRIISAELCINNYNVKYDGKEAEVDGKCGISNSTPQTMKDIVNAKTYEIKRTTGADADNNVVYLDPTDLTNTSCTAANSKSTTGTKDGCMKWYYIGESNGKKNFILDHSTTAQVSWSSTFSNTSGMKEVATTLKNDTDGWTGISNIDKTIDNFDYTGYKARLITADEIAMITTADKTTTLQWKSNLPYGKEIGTSIDWFYLDGAANNVAAYNENFDGWQNRVAINQGTSSYAWLYNYTSHCTDNGCDVADESAYGYWTSTPVMDSSTMVWYIRNEGTLVNDNVMCSFGVRPVISI